MARKFDFELLLVRHGDAESWAQGGDTQRALTPHGAAAIERCAPAWEHFDWFWSEAVHSPLLRANQTAHILYEQLEGTFARQGGGELLPPKELAPLTPDSNPRASARAIIELGSRQGGPRPLVAVFGHNPNLSRVASLLVCGEDSSSFSLGRGDVVHLFVPAPSPFDALLAPQQEEPLPRAIVLGVYPRSALELMRP